MKRLVSPVLLSCMLGALVALTSFLAAPAPEAEAAPSISVALVDAAGNAVPGHIPPRVILDTTNSIPAGANTNWKMVRVFNGTEFAARLTGAGGYVDAGFSDTTGTVFTIDVPAGCGGNSGSVETEDVLIKVISPLVFGPPDAGASTVQLDVGISGTTEKFAKDVNLLAAANTRAIGSQTIIFRQPIGTSGVSDGGIIVTAIRNVDAVPLSYRLTVTQSAKNLTTVTGGQFRVFALCGPIHEF